MIPAIYIAGTELPMILRCHPAWCISLHPLFAYHHTPPFFIRRVRPPSPILRRMLLFCSPSEAHSFSHFPPRSHQRRFSVKKSGKNYLHFLTGFSIVNDFINLFSDSVKKIIFFDRLWSPEVPGRKTRGKKGAGYSIIEALIIC